MPRTKKEQSAASRYERRLTTKKNAPSKAAKAGDDEDIGIRRARLRNGQVSIQIRIGAETLRGQIGEWPKLKSDKEAMRAKAITRIAEMHAYFQAHGLAAAQQRFFPGGRYSSEGEALTAPKGTTFESIAWSSHEYWLLLNPGVKERTKKETARDLKNILIPMFQDRAIQTITAIELDKWYLSHPGMTPLSTSRRNNLRIILNHVFKYALREKLISENPVQGMDKDITKRMHLDADANIEARIIHPFTKREVALILESIQHPVEKRMVTVAVYTGMRPGELIGMRWEDLERVSSKAHNRYTVNMQKTDEAKSEPPKNDSIRTFDMLAPAVQALAEQFQETHHIKPVEHEHYISKKDPDIRKRGTWVKMQSKWVWYNRRTGRPYPNAKAFSDMFERVMADAIKHARAKGVILADRPAYQLRHTYASMMLTAGMSLQEVSRDLGHKDVLTTDRHYATFIAEDAPSQSAYKNRLLGL